jgi:hypothetical protein
MAYGRHPAPSYVSSRSADIILSEIRPTKIKPETLLSINVLLDELLWLVLGSARSLTPPRLKSSFNKILATNLGKAAILEAEVELRAYKDRANGAALSDDEFKPDEFPLQAIFEVRRTPCPIADLVVFETNTNFRPSDDLAVTRKVRSPL